MSLKENGVTMALEKLYSLEYSTKDKKSLYINCEAIKRAL